MKERAPMGHPLSMMSRLIICPIFPLRFRSHSFTLSFFPQWLVLRTTQRPIIETAPLKGGGRRHHPSGTRTENSTVQKKKGRTQHNPKEGCFLFFSYSFFAFLLECFYCFQCFLMFPFSSLKLKFPFSQISHFLHYSVLLDISTQTTHLQLFFFAFLKHFSFLLFFHFFKILFFTFFSIFTLFTFFILYFFTF